MDHQNSSLRRDDLQQMEQHLIRAIATQASKALSQHPHSIWLNRLWEAGRLVVPFTIVMNATIGQGVMTRIMRSGGAYSADPSVEGRRKPMSWRTSSVILGRPGPRRERKPVTNESQRDASPPPSPALRSAGRPTILAIGTGVLARTDDPTRSTGVEGSCV